MALKGAVPPGPPIADLPQMARFPPEKTSTPQIPELLTGIAGRTAAEFMRDWTIGFISDESSVFMSFRSLFVSFASFFMSLPFLLILIAVNHRGLIRRRVGPPDQAGTPNYV